MVGPLVPLDPVEAQKPLEGLQSSAPQALGPRVQGQNSRPLTAGKGLNLKLPKLNLNLPKLNVLPRAGEVIPPQAPPGPVLLPPDPISAPFEKPQIEHHPTVTGFVKNFAADVYTFIQGVPAMAKQAATAGIEIWQGKEFIPMLLEDTSLVGRELDATMKNFIKGMTHPYRNGLGEALYKHPFTVLLDAAGAASLAGSLVRNGGKAAIRAGLGESGKKLINLGDKIEQLPGTILRYPVEKAGEAIIKAPIIGERIHSLGKRLALTRLGTEVKNLYGTQWVTGQAEASLRARQALTKGLKRSDRLELEEIIDGLKPIDAASNDAIKRRAMAWKGIVSEDEIFMQEVMGRTLEELSDGRVKPLAARLHARGEFQGELLRLNPDGTQTFTREALDFAKDWSVRNRTEPIYRPFYHERSLDPGDLFAVLKKGDDAEFMNYVARLEKKTGFQSGALDPDVWMSRSIVQIENLKANIRFITEATQKWGRPLRTGQASKGYRIINPILTKYINDGLVNGYQKLIQNAVEAVGKAPDGQKAAAFAKAIAKTGDDLMESRLHKTASDIANDPKSVWLEVPEEVAAIIEANLGHTNPLVKAYDRVLNTWRTTVLTLMPRYYVNNILGNSVLLMFGGVMPFTKSTAFRQGTSHLIPGEMASTGATLAAEGASTSSFLFNLMPRKLRLATEALQEVTDIRPRQVLFNKIMIEAVERDALMGDTVTLGFLAGKSAEEAVEAMLAVRRESLGLGQEAFVLSRRIGESGEFQRFASAVQGKTPSKLTAIEEAQVNRIDAQLRGLQRQIDTEKDLSRLGREEGNGRIADLRAQMERLAGDRRKIAPDRDLLRMGQLETEFPDIARLQKVQQRIEEVRPVVAKVENAILKMEAFLGNYGRLHPLEREYVRRIIPFWTFAKTMNALVFRLPFIKPKTAFLWHQYSAFMMDSVDDERMPMRFRQMLPLPVGATEDGGTVFIRMAGWNPFEAADINEPTHFGGVPVPSFLDIASNPFIKMIVENRGGYDTFTEQPFVGPTQFVSLWGAVYEVDQDTGQIEKVIPQKPLYMSLMQQIPHVKIAAELLDSLGARKAGGALGARTRQNPDGTYTYDRTPMWALSRSFGFPISVSNPERVARTQMLIKKSMVQRFRSAMKRLPPDDAADVAKALDYIDSETVIRE